MISRSLIFGLALLASSGSRAESTFIPVSQNRMIHALAEGEYWEGDPQSDEVSAVAEEFGHFDESVSTDIYLHTFMLNGSASQDSNIDGERIHASGYAGCDKLGGDTLFASANSDCVLQFALSEETACRASLRLVVANANNVTFGTAETRIELRSDKTQIIANSLNAVDVREVIWVGILSPGVYTLEAFAGATTDVPTAGVSAGASFEFVLTPVAGVSAEQSSIGRIKSQFVSPQD